jgi:mannose-6-phosphate isomerase-like protein (cupin superfamily)
VNASLAFDDAGAGPVVVLIHGHPFDRSMWSPQHRPLVDAGFRVVAPDLRGYGAFRAGALAVERPGRVRRTECDQGGAMKTTILPEHPDAKSPAGADIRSVMACEAGNMIHSTVPPQQVNRATMHATVSELWFVLEGRGEIWRNDGDESGVTALVPGTSVDIPVGTAFQYRNTGDADLTFICVSMPPWPGDSEATYVEGKWPPTI